MMKRCFAVSTALFWIAIAGVWLAALLAPAGGDARAGDRGDATYGLAQVARHATRSDCWMAIDGQVYDFSRYLPQHPAPPAVIEAWCGRDASEAFRTKTVGRPHSPYAASLLPAYRIGRIGD